MVSVYFARAALRDWRVFVEKRREPIALNVGSDLEPPVRYWPRHRWPRPEEVPATKLQVYAALAQERATGFRRTAEVMSVVAAVWLSIVATGFREDFLSLSPEETFWSNFATDMNYLLPLGLVFLSIQLRDRRGAKWTWVANQYRRRAREIDDVLERRRRSRRRGRRLTSSMGAPYLRRLNARRAGRSQTSS